jgi:hypothetical protein
MQFVNGSGNKTSEFWNKAGQVPKRVERRDHEDVCILQAETSKSWELELDYSRLVNKINEFGGRVHGSQYQYTGLGGSMSIAVYYTIPKDAKNEFELSLRKEVGINGNK